jgi:hypothetical protein
MFELDPGSEVLDQAELAQCGEFGALGTIKHD